MARTVEQFSVSVVDAHVLCAGNCIGLLSNTAFLLSTDSKLQVSDPKTGKARSTLHNFCQLGLAPAPGSDPKKKRSTLHNFCQLVLAPARSSLVFFRLALRKHKRNDISHSCYGRRIQISGHSDFGILNSDGASSILTRVQADTATAACPEHPGSLDMISITFCSRHLWCWWSLLGEYCIRSWIIFYNVNSEYDSTFLFLKLWLQLRILEMTEIH